MWRPGEDEERSFSVGPQPAAFACRLGGRHDHSVVTEAKAGALGLNGAESADASIPGVRIWGPVPEAQAIGAGAIAAASSVLIAPQRNTRPLNFSTAWPLSSPTKCCPG